MLTNPNTLGLFEENILEMADIVHGAGGKLYYDGANLNAVMSKARPGDMGFDVCSLKLAQNVYWSTRWWWTWFRSSWSKSRFDSIPAKTD